MRSQRMKAAAIGALLSLASSAHSQTLSPPPPGPMLDLHGGLALYLYQPTNGPDGQMFVYANAKLDANWDWLGLYFEPRMSSEKMRSYYDSLAWIQQAYVRCRAPSIELKLGKLYKRSGLGWDRSFYGNIQVYEGLKFDPNLGASLESQLGKQNGVRLVAQYFYIDGHLNASLLGRDTVSYDGARRRNTVLMRVEPYFKLAPNARLELGLSGETFNASFAEDGDQVGRVSADVTLEVGRFSAWGEALGQWGAHVPMRSQMDLSPGQGSRRNVYLLAGAELKLGPIRPRYNLSVASYEETHIREVLHLPGLNIDAHPRLTVFVEFAFWDRVVRGVHSLYDQSLNLTALGTF